MTCDEKKTKHKLFDRPPEVIRRWVRLRLIQKSSRLTRWIMRRWLPLRERRRRRALESAFLEIKNQTIQAERHGYEATLTIFNIALYLMLAERDMQAVKIDALTHPDWWIRHLSARVILLILHEWDMDRVSGRRLRESLLEIQAPKTIKNEVTESLRATRNIQKKARRELGYLRNATIAHRDPDALMQYRAIRDLRVERVIDIASEFYSEAQRFIDCVPKLMITASTTSALLRQLKAKRKR